MFNNMKDRGKVVSEEYKFHGNYRGEVIDNKDPLEAGRVRIRVFGVFDGLPDDHLPWAIFTDPFMGGLSDIGSAIIPNIGSHVWCFFENGDHLKPVYFGGAPAIKDDGDLPDLIAESRTETTDAVNEYTVFEGESADPIDGPEEVTHTNGEYPFNKVIRTKQGITIEIDDSEDNIRIRMKHPSGTQKEIDNNGNVYHENVKDEINLTKGNKKERTTGDQFETVMGNETTHTEGNTTATVIGNWEVSVDGHVKIMAPEIELGESGLEPVVLGDTLASWVERLVQWADTHTHIGNMGSPTSPPQEPLEPDSADALPNGSAYSTKNSTQ